mmetsp:Transcript_10044/g.14434  ORF Transcript_10044/g.14434 Transcript_10044/m.14434 type:complete len:106 (-) Transcript_10044:68-385(-)
MLDFIIQADEYEERFGTDLGDFFEAAPPSRFYHERLRQVAHKVHEIRNSRVQERENMKKRETYDDQLRGQDRAFIEEFSRASPLESNEIAAVISGLRHWEALQWS